MCTTDTSAAQAACVSSGSTRPHTSTIEPDLRAARAVLIGTGTVTNDATETLVGNLIQLTGDATVILDAGGLSALRAHPRLASDRGNGVVAMPNPGEANLLPGRDAL